MKASLVVAFSIAALLAARSGTPEPRIIPPEAPSGEPEDWCATGWMSAKVYQQTWSRWREQAMTFEAQGLRACQGLALLRLAQVSNWTARSRCCGRPFRSPRGGSTRIWRTILSATTSSCASSCSRTWTISSSSSSPRARFCRDFSLPLRLRPSSRGYGRRFRGGRSATTAEEGLSSVENSPLSRGKPTSGRYIAFIRDGKATCREKCRQELGEDDAGAQIANRLEIISTFC